MGCKAPQPGSSFGPAKGCQGMFKGGGGASPYGCMKGKGGGKGGKAGEWQCDSCGFSNRPGNEVCGGNGPMGCKAPPGGGGFGGGGKGYAPMPMMLQMPMKGKGGGKGGEWMCSDCGFSNRPSNEVCGGNGPMGCKKPNMGGFGGGGGKGMMSMKGGFGGGFKGMGKMMDMGKGKAKGGGEWSCEACGFANKAMNEVCGGKGPMGCKAEKPGDWVCDCGFINKPRNDVCGGAGGKMGCKAPRPEGNSLINMLAGLE